MSNLIRDGTGRAAIDHRNLSVQDRVAIADSILVKESLRTIAGRIRKNVSAVARLGYPSRAFCVGMIFIPFLLLLFYGRT
ncbi:MAG: hypothetical protein NT146_17470 [Mycobacterium sp.]|nr:hypothetical protein [Mycobacterium sp.]